MHPGVTFDQPAEEDVYDWSGDQLTPDIRRHLGVNHIVRIQVRYPQDLFEALYVQITGVDGADLTGTVLDTYRNFLEGETIYVENGETLRFPRACVMEVPLSWNPDLLAVAQKIGLGRTVTGVLPARHPS